MNELVGNKKAQFVFKRILELISEWIREKRTGKLVIEMAYKDGGIGLCKIKEEKELLP